MRGWERLGEVRVGRGWAECKEEVRYRWQEGDGEACTDAMGAGRGSDTFLERSVVGGARHPEALWASHQKLEETSTEAASRNRKEVTEVTSRHLKVVSGLEKKIRDTNTFSINCK